jgi:hypothetical protein
MEFVKHIDHSSKGNRPCKSFLIQEELVSMQWLSKQAQLDTAGGSGLGHAMRKSKCEDEVEVWEQIQ